VTLAGNMQLPVNVIRGKAKDLLGRAIF